MFELRHEIEINALPEVVTDALTTQEGLRCWWTTDATAEPKVGSIAEFGFHDRAVLFRMRVDEIHPGRRVLWSCLGDHPEWKDTTLVWTLDEAEQAVRLRLSHEGWKSTDGVFAVCNTTWGHLMVLLKQYTEGGKPVLYFP